MFGGLDLKGGKTNDEGNQESPAPSPASGGSAFSFLNSTTADPAAPTTSAFGFLNSTNAEPAPEPAPAPSAFSFFSSPAEAKEAVLAPAPAGTSSFSFLQPAAPSNDIPPKEVITESTLAPRRPAGFSFMATEPESSISTAGSGITEPTDLMGATKLGQTSSTAPSGAGVAFGKATVPPITRKKRATRARTTKVGTATNQTSSMSDTSAARPHIPSATPTPSVPPPSSSHHDEAAEAARRAEEFMHEKMAKQVSSNSTPTEPIEIPSIQKVDSQDEEVKAARAAAQEARQMGKQQRSFVGGALGGLFRPRPTSDSHSATSQPPAATTGASTRIAPAPPPPPPAAAAEETTSVPSAASLADETEMTPADRLRREQEEVQRSIAERQLRMMQTMKQEEPEKEETERDYEAYEPTGIPASVISVPQVKTKVPTPRAARHVATSAHEAKTATDYFNQAMVEFREKVVRSMEEVSSLRQQRVQLLDQRFAIQAKVRLAMQQKEQAEKQQIEAADSEDFELADKMGTIIENEEQKCAEHASVVDSIQKAIVQLDSQKQQVVEGVSNCFRDIQENLKGLQEKEEQEDKKDSADSLKKLEATSKQISTEQERLDQDLKHIERDEKLVEEESKELENTISEQAGEFDKQLGDAKTKLSDINDEIEELRKQLNAKQAQAAELRTEIAGFDESILRVRVKFQRQIDRVSKKKNTIRDHREEWEAEKAANDKLKDSHERQVAAHSETLLAHERLLNTLSSEIEMADTFGSILAKEMNFGVSENDRDSPDDDLMALQADVVKCEAALAESKGELAEATSHLTKLGEEIKTLEIQIPQLEEAKKAAAARRDFKTAGKASKEAKEYTARLTSCRDHLTGEAQARKAAAEEEVKSNESALETKRKIANEREKVFAMDSMQRLADNIRRFQATKESICGGVEPNSIREVGSYVLDGQIKILLMEGEAFGEKFGGWDELMADCVGRQNVEKEETSNAEHRRENSRETDAEDEAALPETDATAGNTGSEEQIKSKKGTVLQFKNLTLEVKQVESDIEAAVEKEEFEQAAALDDRLQSLIQKLGQLDLTEDEMEAAMSGEQEESSSDTTQIVPGSSDGRFGGENAESDDKGSEVNGGDDRNGEGDDQRSFEENGDTAETEVVDEKGCHEDLSQSEERLKNDEKATESQEEDI